MNGLTVAVWGNKGAGTTTFTAALAQSLSKYFRSILLISGDKFQPAFAVWGVFENPLKQGKVHLNMNSIGHILSFPNLTAEFIKQNIIVHPNNSYIGLMGYLYSDDCERYRTISGNAAQSLFSLTRKFTQLTLVDCTLPQLDPLTDVALQNADIVIILLEPDPKGMGFISAQNNYIKRNLVDHRKYIFLASKVEPKSALIQFEDQHAVKFYKYRLPYTHEAIKKLSQFELFKEYDGEYQETVDAMAQLIKEDAENGRNN